MQIDFDILIVGAGLSGIGAAYHIQDKCPGQSYAIFEGRGTIGGTWDFFRYPGFRSDSDMYTLGYSFRPWNSAKAIADGPSILSYIADTAKDLGIDRHIRLNHRVTGAKWSSAEGCWSLSVTNTVKNEVLTMRCRFLIMCCGYYDYDKGYTPDFPGLESFAGKFIHPQEWDTATDYRNKRVIVIGSGATAVTLVPELAKSAKHVVMLQRSPSYVMSLPSVDAVAEFLKRYLPTNLASFLIRWKNIFAAVSFVRFCRTFPQFSRRFIIGQTTQKLQNADDQRRHFTPSYAPWDQRLCFVPDDDLYQALNSGKAEIVTDTITSFTPTGIRLSSGREISADMIVSATGLNLKFLGGVTLHVDGRLVDIKEMVPYKGAMISGIPNLGLTFGYTAASWTLKTDLICDWLARMIRYMQRNSFTIVTPEPNPKVERSPLIDLSSGYIQRSVNSFPRQGDRKPWKINQDYFADIIAFRWRRINDVGLNFSRKKPKSAHT